MAAAFSFGMHKALNWLVSTKCGTAGSLLVLCGIAGLGTLVPDFRPGNAIVAALFLAVAAVLLGIHTAALRRDRHLIRTGRTVPGQVDGEPKGILMHSGPAVFMRHFSVQFHYTVDGITYQGRSRFYWIAPALPANGSLTVYVDPADPRRCTVDLWTA